MSHGLVSLPVFSSFLFLHKLSAMVRFWRANIQGSAQVVLWKRWLCTGSGWQREYRQIFASLSPLWEPPLAHRIVFSSSFFPNPDSCASGVFPISQWWLLWTGWFQVPWSPDGNINYTVLCTVKEFCDKDWSFLQHWITSTLNPLTQLVMTE